MRTPEPAAPIAAPRAAAPAVSILVVSYATHEMTLACLRSVLAETLAYRRGVVRSRWRDGALTGSTLFDKTLPDFVSLVNLTQDAPQDVLSQTRQIPMMAFSPIENGIQKISKFISLIKYKNAYSIWLLSIRRLIKSNKILKVKIKNAVFHIRPLSPDLNVLWSTMHDEFAFALNIYESDQSICGLIIDGGGYIGSASVALARMFPNATIVTIEPSSENFALLQKNVAPYPNIVAIHAALDTESNRQIVLTDRGTGEWGFSTQKTGHESQCEDLEEVSTISIDDLLAQHPGDDLIFVKLDIEGAERQILENTSWPAVAGVMCVELHDRIIEGCEAAFRHACRDHVVIKFKGEKYFAVNAGVVNAIKAKYV